MNRSTFLKALLAPLLAPLVKFLPTRKVDASDWFAIDTSRVGAFEASTVFPTGVVKLVGTEDLRISDAIYWEDGNLIGYALHDASPGETVLVSLGP